MTTEALPPPPLPEPMTFGYRAQSADQQIYTGTIEARNLDEARGKLAQLQLRVLDLQPQRRPRTRRLGGEDLIAFNQQLAHLARAGLPLEHGLRLIAADMRRGGMARAVREVATELEHGTPLDEAFAKHRGNFPPLYGRLLAAGVKTNDLPGMLLNIGAHLQLIYRLRAALWRAAAYPMVVLVALSLIVAFIGAYLLPQFEVIFDDFGTRLPGATRLLLDIGVAFPVIGLSVVALVIGMPILWAVLVRMGWDRAIADALLLPLPLVGPVLKRNLVARWCDVMKLSVEAGLDLPQAIRLANQTIGSRSLMRDGEVLAAAIESGQSEITQPMRLLPATVPAAMNLAARGDELAETLGVLSRMQQEQAELRLQTLPVILAPFLLVLVAGAIGFIILALFAPFISLIQAVTG